MTATHSTQRSSDPLLADLTEPQLEAVRHVEGPLLVLAGAGSGKTRVITRRIAHLVLRVGIAPWNVLAITFTNKAAQEMRERVAALVSEKQARALTVATFHSLCARILRQYAPLVGLPPGYSIYDSADQQKAVKQAVEELQMSVSNFPPGSVHSTISNAKNQLIDADAFAKNAGDFYSKSVAKIYARYQKILTQNKAVDFDDLLLLTVKLMAEHPDALAQLRQRFQYLLIDEYQDTNHAQFLLAHTLAAGHKNICATGDPDQSIYAWRGADIGNILDFETHYPNAKVVRLEQNYRSTKNILLVADKLISFNKRRKHKSLWTENETGDRVRLATATDERAEARFLVEWFKDLHLAKGLGWGEMAVFYRMNSLSRVLEDAFRTANVPYQIARGTSFYERKEIKDAIAYLRLIANPDDAVNLLRVINVPPRGISPATVKAIQAQALASGLSVREVVNHPAQVGSLTTRAADAVRKFAATVESWRKLAGLAETGATPASAEALSFRGFVERVLRESGLEDHYRNDKSDPDGERIENLGELVSSAQQFETDFDLPEAPPESPLEVPPENTGAIPGPAVGDKLNAYLEQVSLVSDVDSIKNAGGAVTLMTLHAAKGLEFPAVAIVALEDGLLPHQRASAEDLDAEEERRLCFVGITRAQRFLTLSRARMRTVFGQTLPTIPSRFLAEMPQAVLETLDIDGEDDGQDESEPAGGSGLDLTAAPFPPGTMVKHPQFGVGKILTVSMGSAGGVGSRAQVHFQRAGVKTLILEYARLERV